MSSDNGDQVQQPQQAAEQVQPDAQSLEAIFEAEAEAQVRRTWHEGRWWYSVVDICGFLSESENPGAYWRKLKQRLGQTEQSQAVTDCHALKLKSRDGKLRETDCADRETVLRLVQSIPSPKAEPFKRWLARIGEERLAEIEDSAAALERLRKQYARLGYSDAWIGQRLKYITTRNALTDEWSERGAEGSEFGVLTDTIHRGTFALPTAEHKHLKAIGPRADLQDSMTPIELALSSLANVTATALHQERESQGFEALQQDAHEAGQVGGAARADIENRLGHTVVSNTNYKHLRQERQRQLQPSLLDVPGEPEDEA